MVAAIAFTLSLLVAQTATAQATAPSPATIRACIDAAAVRYRLPPVLLVILLNVEGGVPGRVHGNANGTVDIGPMQINQIWLPTLAAHWHASVNATYAAIRSNFCANVAGGSWILRRAIDQAGGHLWQGVGWYHSHNRRFEADYLHAVLREAGRLDPAALHAAESTR